MSPAREAVLLVAHGTVDDLAELPEFLANIRHGHAPPDDLLREVERRYRAIGGSPLNAVNRLLADRLEEALGIPVRLANRLCRPYPKDVVAALTNEGVQKLFVVPLAQFSAPIYEASVREAARALDVPGLTLRCAPNWGQLPGLIEAFAGSVEAAVCGDASWEGEEVAVIFTAHSLPQRVVEAGDPYEGEVRSCATRVAQVLAARRPSWRIHPVVAFQSQGLPTSGGRPMAWLGPDLRATLAGVAERGIRRVVFSPIGFLADHVEILFDLDVEARDVCASHGLTMRRAPSLNAETPLVEVLTGLVRSLREG